MVDTAGVDFVEFSTAVVIAFPNLVIADFSSVICFSMDAVEVVEKCSKMVFKTFSLTVIPDAGNFGVFERGVAAESGGVEDVASVFAPGGAASPAASPVACVTC